MPAATTLITPAENRFFLLSERARRHSSLHEISSLLHQHVTVKADSPFLKATVRNLIVKQHAAWLRACSHEWQLLASLPYVINPSSARRQWHRCELCHQPVRYEYHVVSKANQRELIVGSECVKKFMNAETRYLMVITTEDNFYAVQQYQTLTTQLPSVPAIMFAEPWLPELPATHRPQARTLRRETTATVTTYLRHRTPTVPLKQLAPAQRTYQQLVETEQTAIASARKLAEQQVEQAQHAQQQQRQQSVQTARERLRHSAAYRRYLADLAAIIVLRPDLAVAKRRFGQLSAPTTSRPLLNAYQFSQLVNEYRQTGQLKGRRSGMLAKDLVQDLDQVTRQLDARETTRFYDDLFNSCWGWDYPSPAAQQHDWQRLLTTRWGQTLSLTWFHQLAQQTTPAAIQNWLATQASPAVQRAIGHRLTTHATLTPIPRTTITAAELQTFCERAVRPTVSLATVQNQLISYYQLPAAQQATLQETVAHYYVSQQYAGDHQAALQRVQTLLTAKKV
ncbi:hypothetical protein [Lactiplantibacillus modestisalitolerans]|uniref:Uncharacterized protein n=1 Tax=Lactiplantibacillus modestisalitolerans TaxID=1457219 RepID=A0ABV5WRB1_9LACO|nr:hypothetical protein [Lactiplantibacillus modestisalitolerans]